MSSNLAVTSCCGVTSSFYAKDSALNFFQDKLKLVDLLTWDKGKIGMGKRTRRRCEHAMFFQKAPHVIRTKQLVTWKTMPCIADVWAEPIKDKIHPHQKPFGLQKALIEATTEPGDVVIDPVARSFSVMHAAHACGRRFLGGDILGAISGIDRCGPGLAIELVARETGDGWNSGNDKVDKSHLTDAGVGFATGPTSPAGKAILPLQATRASYGLTGSYRS